jgi:uncharacterized protein (TIRG00374 family)
MRQRLFRIGTLVVRWGIAIGGIWWVVSQMSLRDSVMVMRQPGDLPVRMVLAAEASPADAAFRVIDPANGQTLEVPRDQTVSKPDGNGKTVRARLADDLPYRDLPLIGLDLAAEAGDRPVIRRLLVNIDGKSVFIRPSTVEGGFRLRVPNPRIDTGLINLASRANHWLLVAAIGIFPVTFILTSVRWHRLLRGVGVVLPLRRVFVLNMVGNFYNTFMPGSTGGDVLKAIYAARQTSNRAAAVMSVIIDRILGLLTLVILGGLMAGYQYLSSPHSSDPSVLACRNVALASFAILACTALGVTALGWPSLRKSIGLDWLLRHLPAQSFLDKILEVMRCYRSKPTLIAWSILVTFPVHLAVIVSAWLSGSAFGLPISPGYYFVVVPVVVLVGAIPLAPQGAGVMELFATMLLARQGANVSHAIALTLSIRVVQILWNLSGAIFVLRGGFHAPSQKEIDEVDTAEPVAPGR